MNVMNEIKCNKIYEDIRWRANEQNEKDSAITMKHPAQKLSDA